MAPSAPMLEQGTQFDKYTIVRLLGEGGMGMVYEATNPFGISVVLKMLHPQLVGQADVVERFRREGRIQYTLRHPNIVRVTDIIEQDGVPALVVDFMKGRDLEEHMILKGPLSVEDTIRVSTLMLDALHLAHAHGFFHRDLKPGNIFLEFSGATFEPRLMDFGIAKIEEAAALTRAQEFCGTPAFASPEQIASTKDVDHLTDIYSFGVVMWSMCVGEEPYKELGEDPYAVLSKVVREELPPLPDTVPAWLRDVIGKATRKDPAERFQTAALFRDAIVTAAASDTYADTVVDFAKEIGAISVLGEETTITDLRGSATQAMGSDDTQAMPATDSLSFGLDDTPPSESIREGLRRNREREERRAAADLTGNAATDLAARNRVAESMGSDFEADGGIDQSGHVISAKKGQHSDAQRGSKPRRAPRRAAEPEPKLSRADARRAREVEASFRGGRKRGLPLKFKLAVAAVVVLLVGAVGVWNYLGSQPQNAPEGFVRIEPQSFLMGSPADEPGRGGDETAHEVRITRPFAIQTGEVTQAAWTNLMYSEPDAFADCGAGCPITNVDWIDAIRYANRYSIENGLQPCYEVDGGTVTWPDGLDCPGYRLPTEAEWELAARAGSDGAFSNGDLMNTGRELMDPRLSLVGWYGANSDASYRSAVDCTAWGEGRENCGPQPVKTRRANAWGIYDMHGNVAEWVWDRYAPYPEGAAVDPTGAGSGAQRVIRGGSWKDTAESCRSAARDRSVSTGRNHIGFRLARTLR